MESTGGDSGKPKFEIALTAVVVVAYLFGDSSRRRGAPSLPSGASGNYLPKVPNLLTHRLLYAIPGIGLGRHKNRNKTAEGVIVPWKSERSAPFVQVA